MSSFSHAFIFQAHCDIPERVIDVGVNSIEVVFEERQFHDAFVLSASATGCYG